MRRLTLLLTCLVLLICTRGLPAQDEVKPAFTAGRVDGKIKLDGKLDEPDWQAVRKSSTFMHLKERAAGGPPPQTWLKVLASDDAVYLGVHCAEPKMDQLKDDPVERDGPIFRRDILEMFLDPEGTGVTYYQFVLSAGNDQWDAYFIEGGNTMMGEFSTFWQSAVHKGDGFWSVEVRLPLSAFYYTDSSTFSDTWKLNVSRQRKPVGQLLTWSKLRFGFHEPSSFNHVAGMPKKHPRFDVRMTGMDASLYGRTDGGTLGSLTISTEADRRTAGDYRLSLWVGDTQLAENRPVKLQPGGGSIELSDLVFPELGKVQLKARLESPEGELRNGLYATLRLRWQPLTIDVTEPFYARCIFPDEDVRQVKGTVTVNLPEGDVDGATLEVKLSGPGAPGKPSSTKLTGRTGSFTLDATKLKRGDFTLHARAVKGGNVLAEGEVELRKLAPPRATQSIRVDRNLLLRIDGKPVYLRSAVGGGAFRMSWPLWQKLRHPGTPYINVFAASVNMAAERIDKADVPRCKLDVMPSQKVFDEMKRRIEANRDNDHFVWYYLADEPECRGLSPVYLKHQYDFIKKHDPYHPVMIISRAPERYTGCADVLSPHPYLGPRNLPDGTRTMKSPKRIRDQMRTVLEAGRGRIPAWVTPQAFSYGFIDSQADYPTFHEFRCMMYTAMVNGATGFTPFTYNGSMGSIDLRKGLPFIYETMFCLDPWLIAEGADREVTVEAPEDGVDAMVKEVDGRVLVVAVNLLDRRVKATVASPAFKGLDRLDGFREDTLALVRGGEVELTFEPYEVHILANPGMTAVNGAGAMTVDELKRIIARARRALKKPGNLLYGRGRQIEWETSHTYIQAKTMYSLCDGLTDCLGFKAVRPPKTPAWVVMHFSRFKPTFRTVKLYTSTVADLELQARRGDDWVTLKKVTGNTAPIVTLRFEDPVSEDSLRVLMTKMSQQGKLTERGWGGGSPELYEIEMYE